MVDTALDTQLLIRIAEIGLKIAASIGAISNGPLIVLPDMVTAARVVYHSEDEDVATYSKESSEEWIARFNKPVPEAELVKIMLMLTNHEPQMLVSNFTRYIPMLRAAMASDESLHDRLQSGPASDLADLVSSLSPSDIQLCAENYPLIFSKIRSYTNCNILILKD